MVFFFVVCLSMIILFFFFSSRRRHTRYIGDWSSDVCSSDLSLEQRMATGIGLTVAMQAMNMLDELQSVEGMGPVEIGRASCRERVEISVVVAALKKKKNEKV